MSSPKIRRTLLAWEAEGPQEGQWAFETQALAAVFLNLVLAWRRGEYQKVGAVPDGCQAGTCYDLFGKNHAKMCCCAEHVPLLGLPRKRPTPRASAASLIICIAFWL